MEQAPYNARTACNATGAAHWVSAQDGVRLRLGHWPLDEARGTVLIFPGRTEYVEKYGPAAAEFAARGYAALAIDWRGQGLADRLHDDPAVGHVDRFTDYQHDARAAVDHARALGLPEPFHLLAHSMGGAIGLRAVMEGYPVETAVFSAPMWGISMAPPLRPLAWGLSSVSRPLGFSHVVAPGQQAESYVLREGFEGNTLTSDRAMFDLLEEQLRAEPALGLGGPSLHWLHAALTETRALSQRAAPALPCLCFLGSDEQIVDTSRIRSRMAHWPRGELVILPGARHEVILEKPALRDTVFDRSVALFDDLRRQAT
ncbi:MAG: alpha/beta hydrolase [Salibaculum sp.]|uniref:alpha/beta hydrolase n=1 Tax=Roseovarius halophilus (ex Wu et al. 2025) TaxID=3376060 RepID=UPI00287050F7|nr:alpha/beta hydrolase [Salibaculum sp.]MDR9426520.1 alpha/beta hydrolase [Salibaculum sp.]MDR9481181.1 alpha/beta hydrolase [Salibaculum sp.]